MANPGTIIGQITEELGELGKKVGGEAAKVPIDIAGKALESLGTASGKKGQPPSPLATESRGLPKSAREATPLDELDQTKDPKIKQTMARRALEYLAGEKPKPKEPSVYEKLQMEKEQQKEREDKQKEAAEKAKLPYTGEKPKRGDFWGVTRKKAGSETSRNVRQD